MCGVHLYKKPVKGCHVPRCGAQMTNEALDMERRTIGRKSCSGIVANPNPDYPMLWEFIYKNKIPHLLLTAFHKGAWGPSVLIPFYQASHRNYQLQDRHADLIWCDSFGLHLAFSVPTFFLNLWPPTKLMCAHLLLNTSWTLNHFASV